MVSRPKPSAPRLEEMAGIYGEEVGIDVVFLVGQGESGWRLPAHKAILRDATPVFRAMFSEHFAPTGSEETETIVIPDLDGRAFDNLLRHLYQEHVTLQAVDTALSTLFAAHKYQAPGLVHLCVYYLNQNVNVSNVLQILSYVPLLCGDIQNLENRNREKEMLEGVAAKLKAEGLINKRGSSNLERTLSEQDTRDVADSEDLDIEKLCASLLQNCLQFVDQEARTVLLSDEMEDLSLDTIRLILKRGTLDISDENVVFRALLNWADKECKRQHLQLTPESKRKVLGDTLFLPRYFTMSLKSFESEYGPAKSSIFSPDEIACLTSVLTLLEREMARNHTNPPAFNFPEKSPSFEIPPTILPYFKTWCCPRGLALPQGDSSPAKKARRGGRGLNLGERWRNRRFCCRNRRRNDRSHNNSNHSSPGNSHPSSPVRSGRGQGQSSFSHSRNWNTAVERIVVFFSWILD